MRGYSCIGLYQPKTNANVGSILRAAWCWADVAFVAITGRRYKKSCTDTMRTYRHKPLVEVDDLYNVIPYDCVPVAVEVNGTQSLFDYVHPERAFYIFGPEDGTLGKSVTKYCRDTVRVPAGCLNLAATVNVVLYDRDQKRRNRAHAK